MKKVDNVNQSLYILPVQVHKYCETRENLMPQTTSDPKAFLKPDYSHGYLSFELERTSWNCCYTYSYTRLAKELGHLVKTAQCMQMPH